MDFHCNNVRFGRVYVGEIMWYVIAGLCGGVVAGLGMGGGTLTIPILTILLSVKQKSAQGINLLGFIPLAVVALIIHSKNKLVEYKKTYIIALTGMLFGVGTSFLAGQISNKWLGKLFALFLIGLAVWQTVQAIKNGKKANKKATKNDLALVVYDGRNLNEKIDDVLSNNGVLSVGKCTQKQNCYTDKKSAPDTHK